MPLFDGHVKQLGVDASTFFNETAGLHNADSVNRKYRGGLNQTRDPFHCMSLSFVTTAVKDIFRNGNVSGVFAYHGIAPGTNPHIIVAVGDSILAGRVSTREVNFRLLYRGIDPQWEHSFFVQQQNLLVWQNGKELPLAWDGTQANMKLASSFSGVTNPMPVGNIMVSANGRILVATEANLVFASNYVYSKGIGTTNGALDFTESTYPNSGDGFGAYSEIGEITGMATLPAPGTSNGDGETIVFGPRGAWSIATNKPRDTWTASEIQRKVLVGRGTVSPYSLVAANNDIWYRSSDRGIASFRTQLTDKASRWSDQSLSSEVQPYLDYDNSINLQFSSGMFIGNRLFMSCAIRKHDSASYGINRYGIGMVVLDFDRGSSTSRQDEGYSWDGLYTGPRVCGMAKLTPDLQERGFFVSNDSDGINRVYEIVQEESEDMAGDLGSEKKIVSYYTTQPLLETQVPSQQIVDYSLTGTRISFRHVKIASFQQDYRHDDSTCWNEVLATRTEGCSNCSNDGCSGDVGKEVAGTIAGEINSTTPDQTKLPSGDNFQIRTTITGRASIRSMRISVERRKIENTAASLFKDQSCKVGCCDDLSTRFKYVF